MARTSPVKIPAHAAQPCPLQSSSRLPLHPASLGNFRLPLPSVGRWKLVLQGKTEAASRQAMGSKKGSPATAGPGQQGTFHLKPSRIILCFGNPYLKEDNIAIQIAKELKLKNTEFRIITDPAQIMEYAGNEEIIIMDAVKGIKKVTVITDIDQLKEGKKVTMHDMDLGFYLQLLKEMKIVKKVRIIGVPMDAEIETAKKEMEKLLAETN